MICIWLCSSMQEDNKIEPVKLCQKSSNLVPATDAFQLAVVPRAAKNITKAACARISVAFLFLHALTGTFGWRQGALSATCLLTMQDPSRAWLQTNQRIKQWKTKRVLRGRLMFVIIYFLRYYYQVVVDSHTKRSLGRNLQLPIPCHLSCSQSWVIMSLRKVEGNMKKIQMLWRCNMDIKTYN